MIQVTQKKKKKVTDNKHLQNDSANINKTLALKSALSVLAGLESLADPFSAFY